MRMRESQYQKTLTLAIPESHYRWIKETSDRKRVSMGEIVRRMILKSMEEKGGSGNVDQENSKQMYKPNE